MPGIHSIHCDLHVAPCRSRYAGIVEKSIDGVVVIGGDGSVLFANRAAEELLGRPAGGLQGKSGDFLSAGVDGSELRVRREDGTNATVEIRLVDAEWGGEALTLAFLRDVTDRRYAEEALRTAIARLEEEKAKSDAIIAAIGDGITIQDTDFKVIYQNDIHKGIMGDHLGDYCHAAYARRDAVCEDCRMKQSFLDGSIHTVQRRYEAAGQPTMHFEITVSPLMDANGKVIAGIEVVRDITERKRTEEQLRFMSTHDILTGLYNRFYFEQELVKLERGRRFPVSVIMADVDDLKVVNDRLGHVAGDVLLREAADLLRDAFRGEDVVARVGGDEFAVLLPATGMPAVQEVVGRIRECLRLRNEGHSTPINLSLGIAVAESGGELHDALKAADQRMYEDKLTRTGRPPRRAS